MQQPRQHVETEGEWMTITAAAALCRVTRNTMRSWVNDGLVEAKDGTNGWPVVNRPFIIAWLRREAVIPAQQQKYG